VARGLGALGLRRESRIVLLLPDTVEFLIAYWGAIRTGIVAIPLKQAY
jgi:acyl-CoA synthetase (AMP-forming)/AMP-acid ligase II